MNRPGQPQQRAPNLAAANPALSTQFRSSYAPYPMPQRSVIPGAGSYVPSLQPNSHRTTQQSQVQVLTPQSNSPFSQARGQNAFPFGGGALGQHQSLQQPIPSQQQQPQANGAQTSMTSLLSQSSTLTVGPSSTTEVSLDDNDFPALGSAPVNPNTTGTNNNGTAAMVTTTSYASQAGTGVLQAGGSGNAVGSSTSGTREFTPDEFPALGGQTQTTQQPREPLQNQLSAQDSLPHPPGLNGFQSSELQQQQLRQTLLGGHSSGLQQVTPGMLNLGPTQSRNIHPGFQGQTESEKQQQRNNYSLKLNQASHAAWNSANVNLNPPTQQPGGVTGPNASFSQTQSTHATGAITNPSAPPINNAATFPTNGLNSGDSHTISHPNDNSNAIPASNNAVNPIALQSTSTSHLQHPETPAQQVLISAADRWGLLSLITMMRNANLDADHGLTSIGTDLGTMGLDMSYPGNLYSTFITPWADQSAARTMEPDYTLPSCYLSVQAPSPGPLKANQFSDETLFFMFYSSPRDALQEVAAQELYNRNWRYHKDLRLWITKESGTSPSQKVQGGVGEQGQYTIWDTENWTKDRKDMTVLYADLEEKSVPAFVQAAGLIPASSQPQAATQQQSAQLAASQTQHLPARGNFQMAMAG